MSNKYSQAADFALRLAEKYAKDNNKRYVGSQHILLALCKVQSTSQVILRKHNIDPDKLEATIQSIDKEIFKLWIFSILLW